MKLLSFNELQLQEEDHRKKFIRKKNKHIELMIYSGSHGYCIEHNRMDTPQKVLGWICHLSKKTNVKKDHIRFLIEAARELGVDVDLHA